MGVVLILRSIAVVSLLFVAACGGTVPEPTQAPISVSNITPRAVQTVPTQRITNPEADFKAVAARVVPPAETVCRDISKTMRCDFLVLIDNRYPKVVNAYQTQDRSGRPVIVFSVGLLNSAQNTDELAFVLGHELSHHLAGHLQRQATNSQMGALLAGGLAAIMGGSNEVIDTATRLGGDVGARAYSKSHELEADRLGTLITMNAGYDPIIGSQFFTRIPDPGDKFLGTHPPNASRVQIVRQTVNEVRG